MLILQSVNKVIVFTIMLLGLFTIIPAFATSPPNQANFTSTQLSSDSFTYFGTNGLVFDTNSQNEIIFANKTSSTSIAFGKFIPSINGYSQHLEIKTLPAQTIFAVNVDANDSVLYATSDNDSIKQLVEGGSDITVYSHDADIVDFAVNPNDVNEIYLLEKNTNLILKIDNGSVTTSATVSLPIAATSIEIDSSGFVYVGYGLGSINGVKVLNSDLTQSIIPDLNLETATGAPFYKVGDISLDSNDNLIVLDENYWYPPYSSFPENIHQFSFSNGSWHLDWTGHGIVNVGDTTSPPIHNVSVSCNGEIFVSIDVTGSGVKDSIIRFDSNESTSCGNSDTEPPVITLLGDNPQIVEVGTAYSEFGATAIDDVDGDISSLINIDSSSVNTAVLGTYDVRYDITDSSGNNAIQVVRTINVVPSFNILPPLYSNSNNISNQGRVIPIQFELLDADNTVMTSIPIESISLAVNPGICDSSSESVIGDITELSDDQFRIVDGKYKLNYSTKNNASGCYSFDITVESALYSIPVELK